MYYPDTTPRYNAYLKMNELSPKQQAVVYARRANWTLLHLKVRYKEYEEYNNGQFKEYLPRIQKMIDGYRQQRDNMMYYARRHNNIISLFNWSLWKDWFRWLMGR